VRAETGADKLFNLAFNAMAAWNQIGFMIGGLFCLGLGGLLLGWGISRRLKGQRVEGEIIGVRHKDGFNYPVWRYILPSGETRESTSHVGVGGSARGMETGKCVPLLVDPENPDEAEAANSYITEIIGLILAAPGVLFLKAAFTSGPVTPMTWLMGAGFVAYGGAKLHKLIIPKEQRAASPQAWMAERKAARRAELASIPVTAAEAIVPTPQEMKQQATNNKVAPFLIFAALGLLVLTGYLGQKTAALETRGLRAEGKVVALESSRSHDSTSYYPVVDFTDKNGTPVHFRDNTGSNPPSYRTGEDVTVLYLDYNPQKTAIIDKGIWNWLPSILTGLFALVLGFAGISILRSGRESAAL
jgi:hypothetical protein